MKKILILYFFFVLYLFLIPPAFGAVNYCSSLGYQKPEVKISTNSIKQGESLFITLKNSSEAEFIFYVYMTRGNSNDWANPRNVVNKIGETTLLPKQTLTKEITTMPTTVLGRHYLKVTIFHRRPDCRFEPEFFYFNVSRASSEENNQTGEGADNTNQPSQPGGAGGSGGGEQPSSSNHPVGNVRFEAPLWGTLGDLEREGGGNWMVGLVIRIIRWIYQIMGALAFLAIIYSGLMYISSTGVPDKMEKAKKNLTWAIIGIVIAFLSFVIVEWVSSFIQGQQI